MRRNCMKGDNTMKYFVLTWKTHRHSGIWNALAADRQEAESRLRRWLHSRYPGQRVTVQLDSILPA